MFADCLRGLLVRSDGRPDQRQPRRLADEPVQRHRAGDLPGRSVATPGRCGAAATFHAVPLGAAVRLKPLVVWGRGGVRLGVRRGGRDRGAADAGDRDQRHRLRHGFQGRSTTERVRRGLPVKVGVGLLMVGVAPVRRGWMSGQLRPPSPPPCIPFNRLTPWPDPSKTRNRPPSAAARPASKGQVAKSTDLNGAGVLIAGLIGPAADPNTIVTHRLGDDQIFGRIAHPSASRRPHGSVRSSGGVPQDAVGALAPIFGPAPPAPPSTSLQIGMRLSPKAVRPNFRGSTPINWDFKRLFSPNTFFRPRQVVWPRSLLIGRPGRWR